MKPPVFSYHDPETVADVVGLLGKCENAKLLAGGQSLMPMMNMRYVLPDHLVDLNRVKALAGIREAAGHIHIGAMTRQCDIEFSKVVRENCPLLHEAISHVGHRQTRNRGTLGGSLCQLDPSAELVLAAAALEAIVTVTGTKGSRDIEFANFPLAYMTPAIEPHELLTEARFPLWNKRHGYAFVEFARRHGDFAIVSAAALLECDSNGKITRASLAIGGLGPGPIRVREAEQALVGHTASDALFRSATECCRKLEALGDVHAPATYRQQLATVLSRRALEKAHARAQSAWASA